MQNSLAFTQGKKIFLNTTGGNIRKGLGDYNNLKSTLVHEKDHLSKNHGYDDVNSFQHAEVYLTQISDKTF